MENNINEYYMNMANMASLNSQDPSTKVGAVLISSKGEVLSSGFNDMPRGCKPNVFSWKREGERLETKYPFVVHAEANAIYNYKGERDLLNGATIYVTLFPCNECAKQIVSYGIKRVVYLSDKYHNEKDTIAARMIFDAAGVEYIQYIPEKEEVMKLTLNY